MTTYPLIHRSPVGYLSTFDVPSILERNRLEYYLEGVGRRIIQIKQYLEYKEG